MSRKRQLGLELQYLEKKRKELNDRLLEIDDSDEESGEDLSLTEGPEEGENSNDDTNDNEILAEQPLEEREENLKSKKKSDKSEKPLTALVKNALGDPRASNAIKLAVHADLIKSFDIYLREGLPNSEKEELMLKYAVSEGLEAPILNKQVATKLSEKSVKKDSYRAEAQKISSVALSVISAAITMVNNADENGVDQEIFVERLMDAAKLLAEAQFIQTVSRRACISPLFSKNIREALKTTLPDRFLFGSDLTNLVKQLKEADALFDQQINQHKTSGNAKSPFERKPFSNLQGTNFGAPLQNRPRLFFRGQRGRGSYRGRSSGFNPNYQQNRFNRNRQFNK